MNRGILRKREFWLLWVSLALGTAGGLLAISLSAKYGEEVVGLDSSTASLVISLFAVLNGAGGPVLGFVCDRAGVRRGAAASFLISALSAVLASKADTLPLYLLSFSLLWFTFGSWFAIFPLATSEFLGPEDFDRAYGLVFTAYGSGSFFSLAMNYVGMSWSLSAAFLTIFIFSLAGLLIFLSIGRKSSNMLAESFHVEPRGVAVKHSGLWSPRRRFESGRGYQ
jgi:OFA family oxalate/formate antiporter-like MFS transporter